MDDYRNVFSNTSLPLGILKLGQASKGTIEVPSDTDVFSIALQSGRKYWFELLGSQSGGGTLDDPHLDILSSSGGYVRGYSGYPFDPSVKDPANLFLSPSSGTYYFSVEEEWWGSTGTYSLTVYSVPDDFSDSFSSTSSLPVGNLRIGTPVSGVVEVFTDRDCFTVPMVAGVTYTLNFYGDADSGNPLTDAIFYLYLSRNSYYERGFETYTSFEFTPSVSGEYEIEVFEGYASGQIDTGSYVLLATSGANDSLVGTSGADVMLGGSGDDTYSVDNSGDQVQESTVLNGSTDAGGSDTVLSSVSFTLGSFLETLTLTGAGAVSGTGNELANGITGNAASNALAGGLGADTLIGGTGRDTLLGGQGNDTLLGGADADSMVGGVGEDVFIVDDGGDLTSELAGEGTDRVESSVTWTLATNLEQLVLIGTGTLAGTGNASPNIITGNAADNSLKGLGGVDTLFGGAGADTLNGGAGADSMAGGAGDDVYFLDSVGDLITESAGEGADIIYSALSRILPANVEQLVLTGSANLNGTGNADANVLTGNTGNNGLSGGAGSDTLSGGQGNDSMAGGLDADSMLGGAGDDSYSVSLGDKTVEFTGEGTDTVNSGVAWTLAANVENLVLTGAGDVAGTGNALANVLRGNDGGNRLLGQDGADTLAGGAGNDTLTGGAGADCFLFDTALNSSSNRDYVIGFTSEADKFHLDDDIFNTLTAGTSLTSAQFRSGAGVTTALTSDDRIIYNTSTGKLYYDVDGAGGVAAVQFAVLGTTTHPTLSSGDFVIVG